MNEKDREFYVFRQPHPLTPAAKRVTVTDALREAARTNRQLTVTIVPIVTAANSLCNQEDVFRFEGMKFLTYSA